MGLATQLFKDTRLAGTTAPAKPVLMPKFIGEYSRGRKVYGSGNLHPAPCLVIMRRTGRSGNGGLSEAPHLHYEIRYPERRLNPGSFMDWSLERDQTVFEQE